MILNNGIVNGSFRVIGSLYCDNLIGSLLGNANTATKATQDSAGQQINTTYIKEITVSGQSITLKKGSNTTSTITTQDTKNTAGSTNSTSKLFLVGAASQSANPQTFSRSTAYIGTDGCLYSSSKKVSVEGHTHTYLPLSGGTISGNIGASLAGRYNLGTSDKPFNWVYANVFSGNLSGEASEATHASMADSATTISTTLPLSKGGTGATTAANALKNLGLTATATELNYCKNVTSSIQTQLNGKAASSHTHSYLPLSGGTITGNLNVYNTITIGNPADTSETSDFVFKRPKNGAWDCHIDLLTDRLRFYHNNNGTTDSYKELLGLNVTTGAFTSEVISTNVHAFRSIYGGFGFFLRNDGGSVYFMLTDNGNPYGSYNTYRPITISCHTGKVMINSRYPLLVNSWDGATLNLTYG